MARVIGASGACTLILVLLVACAASAARTEPGAARQLWDDGRKVGGRTEVTDVEGDREVQELGRNGVSDGRVFDAVVVVKPWLQSRALVRFAPADAK
uniref:Cysteine proteinase inhibitor n=1 Tax=Aegilops tauschii TaxID=37682 RepID=R7WG97_AEGTA